MRSLLLAVAVVGLIGCESAQTRCNRISREATVNKWSEIMEDSVEARAYLRISGMTNPTQKQIDSVTALARGEFHAELDSPPSTPVPDTNSKVRPPPRPSDVTWYNEHCYLGDAR